MTYWLLLLYALYIFCVTLSTTKFIRRETAVMILDLQKYRFVILLAILVACAGFAVASSIPLNPIPPPPGMAMASAPTAPLPPIPPPPGMAV